MVLPPEGEVQWSEDRDFAPESGELGGAEGQQAGAEDEVAVVDRAEELGDCQYLVGVREWRGKGRLEDVIGMKWCLEGGIGSMECVDGLRWCVKGGTGGDGGCRCEGL